MVKIASTKMTKKFFAAREFFPGVRRFHYVDEPPVIASAAKQSTGRKQRLDCFVASAPRNDENSIIATMTRGEPHA
jgi:hypothetical protein